MKKFFILIFITLSSHIYINAQSLTDEQKQEIIQNVQKFCTLFEQYCNEDRTLSTQINKLCSGADCSAFDEVGTNKEGTLRYYLYSIQKKYPKNKYRISLSKPSFNDCEIYRDFDYSLFSKFNTVTGSQYQMSSLPLIQQGDLLNIIIIFNIEQKDMDLNRTINKKIIYSVKSNKITAFVYYDSPIIDYSKALDALAQQKYSEACSFFMKAAQNGGDRFSLQKECYIGICESSIFNKDFHTALKYAYIIKDKGLILLCQTSMAMANGQEEKALEYAKSLEKILQNEESAFVSQTFAYYTIGIILITSTNPSLYNCTEGYYYLEKAFQYKDENAAPIAFFIYQAWIAHQADQGIGLSDTVISYTDALEYLKYAANNNFPPAYLPFAIAEHFDVKDIQEAIKWYQKSAENGNAKAMALLGKVLTTEAQFSDRKEEGIKWLKTALASNNLEESIEDYARNIPRNIWPSSKKDVEEYLQQIIQQNNTITNVSPISSSSHSNNNPIMHNTSSNNHIKTNHYHWRYFNCPDSEHYIAGLSVGYVQKQWIYTDKDGMQKYGYWDNSKYISGVQAGFRIEPLFKYGFGLNTGLFYEYYYSKSDPLIYEKEEYTPSLKEHALYLPIDLEYRLNFLKNFQIFFYGGISFDCGISATINTNNKNFYYTEENAYKDSAWKRFNTSYEYGCGIRIFRLQVNFTMVKGFINMSDVSDYKIKQNKNFMCSMSLML